MCLSLQTAYSMVRLVEVGALCCALLRQGFLARMLIGIKPRGAHLGRQHRRGWGGVIRLHRCHWKRDDYAPRHGHRSHDVAARTAVRGLAARERDEPADQPRHEREAAEGQLPVLARTPCKGTSASHIWHHMHVQCPARCRRSQASLGLFPSSASRRYPMHLEQQTCNMV